MEWMRQGESNRGAMRSSVLKGRKRIYFSDGYGYGQIPRSVEFRPGLSSDEQVCTG
jgi:hypothetical protein